MAFAVTLFASAATAAPAAPISGGGAAAPGIPVIRDVICATSCVGLRRATVGAVVQISGARLGHATRVVFPARRGRVVSPITTRTGRTAQVAVPPGATRGQLRVRDDFGNVSRPSEATLDVRPQRELGVAGSLRVIEATTTPRRAYFFGVRSPQLTYVVGGNEHLNDLRIDLVDRRGQIVRSFFRDDVVANTTQTIRWNGKDSSGKPARSGAYSFRIGPQGAGRVARAARESASLGFKLYGFIFPVRGPHSYGDGLGAPRSGHTHQGQDVFARCGTPMVAARGGRVKYAGYHGAAGHYMVIKGRSTGIDFAYMHMVRAPRFKTGQVVRTGQRIGEVGESGNASGCHLHYEMWSAPGWYSGGSFMNPVPSLRSWDRYS